MWQNSSLTSAFGSQNVTLNDSLSNYNYLEFYLIHHVQHTYLMSGYAKYPIASMTRWDVMQQNSYAVISREFNYKSDTSIYITTPTNNDANCFIPYRIVGIK